MQNPYEKLVGHELSQDEVADFSAQFVSFVGLLIEVDRANAADRLSPEKQQNGNK